MASRIASRPSSRAVPRPARKPSVRRAAAGRKLKPAARSRGLDATQIALAADHEDIRALVERIRHAGGVVIGTYRDPLGGRALVHATLPFRAIQPTPFHATCRRRIPSACRRR